VISGVVWKSSDDKIATVSSNGIITAVAAGTATVTATSGSLTSSVAVTVTEA